ncbi:DUF262 domain-containing protein [Tessaracoccus sp. MC1756]|uniref:DUF262 domain-containing protein n=1 Tax=Tessaracoccus sp. MC1756 TaxID=2760311 RepID=UPI001601DED3|nr:DUF262 domain-containing protein [Tessaracoccus sp. MC1756]
MSTPIQGYRTSYVGLFDTDSHARAPLTSIEIPLIQRDYAQGRPGERESSIRSLFLEAIHEAATNGDPLSLDFVFGDEEDATLRPLDGQQRLTTLFLLHWYLALRTSQDVASAPWAKLSYATRPSARRFCQRLIEVSSLPDGELLSDWIIDQPWYLYVWRNDPTIQSMLVMLKHIQSLFEGDDAQLAWNHLTNRETPAVSFYVLRLPEVGAGDEMYIKMNSRGKPLTDFENFKAKFEDTIAHSDRAREIAKKFDSQWSDVLWRFHGGDSIVDDEFMHYLTFVVEVCEWRTGSTPAGSISGRAKRVFGQESDDAASSLAFLEAAFDSWVGVDVAAFFDELFRTPDPQMKPDSRVALFVPEPFDGTNLFEMCCRSYGEWRTERARTYPLGLTLLLFAILIYRAEQTENFAGRIRALRNVIEASGDQIRADRMGAHLRDVQTFVPTGDLNVLTTLNRTQIADEKRKAEFLSLNPDLRAALYQLEDHRLLRGALGAFDLDPATVESRVEAFYRAFAEPSHWPQLTGALLTCGDYFRQKTRGRFQFGSPTTDSWWRVLLTGPADTPLSDTQPVLARFLDRVAASPDPLPSTYSTMIDDWLDSVEAAGHLDWRYYLVKYPETRDGTSGIFVSEAPSMGFMLCALKQSQLNSYYTDPILTAIRHRVTATKYQVGHPTFSGLANSPRWLAIPACDAALRNVQDSLVVRVPESIRDQAIDVLSERLDIRATDDGFRWAIPQHQVEGVMVDAVDRVAAGIDIVTRLLQGFGRLDDRSAFLSRGEALRRAIAEALGPEVSSDWIYAPEDRDKQWIAFKLSAHNHIELVVDWTDPADTTLAVKAYRGRSSVPYPDFNHVPLSADWSDSDEQIIEAFLVEVDRLRSAYPPT